VFLNISARITPSEINKGMELKNGKKKTFKKVIRQYIKIFVRNIMFIHTRNLHVILNQAMLAGHHSPHEITQDVSVLVLPCNVKALCEIFHFFALLI